MATITITAPIDINAHSELTRVELLNALADLPLREFIDRSRIAVEGPDGTCFERAGIEVRIRS